MLLLQPLLLFAVCRSMQASLQLLEQMLPLLPELPQLHITVMDALFDSLLRQPL